MFSEQFADSHDASALAHAIVDTVRELFVVLDEDMRVVAASRSFYRTFTVNPGETQGKLLYELGDGEWNTPKLRMLLGKILSEHGTMEDCEVEHDFPDIGRRTMLLNARKVFYEEGAREYSAWYRGRYRSTVIGAREGRIASAEGCPAWRNPAPNRQQSSDHREYHHVEGEDGGIGGNASAFERCA
jgi:PAS domain-containing protein